MRPLGFLPELPPFPSLPGILEAQTEEEEPEPGGREELDQDFRRSMELKGFDPELIDMGLKVANNLSRPRAEALKVGANYIREMAK